MGSARDSALLVLASRHSTKHDRFVTFSVFFPFLSWPCFVQSCLDELMNTSLHWFLYYYNPDDYTDEIYFKPKKKKNNYKN